jgi:hypothetical protein
VKPLRLLAVAASLGLAGCGAVPGAPVEVTPAHFVIGVDHSYFPLVPGTLWVLEGDEEGLFRREEVRVEPGTRLLWDVECTPLVQAVWIDGILTEITTEWFAEDRDGNVWKFGEEALEWDGQAFVPQPDAWFAGANGRRPWLAFPADPRPGETRFGDSGVGSDSLQIVSVTAVATVPAGVFFDCVEIHENPDEPDDQDIVLYAPGVGRVSESSPDGRVELVSAGSESAIPQVAASACRKP